MMTCERILDELKRFDATERDVCIHGTGVLPEQIREKMVIAPWEPSVLAGLGTAAFRAARLANIAIAAVFNVSGNTAVSKSLVSGRTDEERRYRKYVRAEVFPRVVKNVFS